MRFNLILAVIWLIVAVPILIVNGTGREMFGIGPTDSGMMWGVLAMVLAAYNLFRWFAARAMRRSPPKPEPPPKRRVTVEYHPEFDFSKPGPKTIDVDDQPNRT